MQLRTRTLNLSRPRVMGVINCTPDSFSDGGRYLDVDAAVAHAERMLAEGADIIDVGGESSRPGATPVPEAEECRRVVPVVRTLVERHGCVVSVDTMKPAVMRAACAAGAELINDISALRGAGAIRIAAATGAGVCLMHMQGEPGTMQRAPHYDGVVREVTAFLATRIAACRAAGIPSTRLCVDPGFGFGKRIEHNLALLARLDSLQALGVPLLVGMSRKSMLGDLTGRAVSDRLAGGLAAVTIAVLRGAQIVRTHDVAATVDAVKVAWAVKGATEQMG
ncbi:MAG TPA: dihydropteroate synthase [Nevskiaceae bacterium]